MVKCSLPDLLSKAMWVGVGYLDGATSSVTFGHPTFVEKHPLWPAFGFPGVEWHGGYPEARTGITA
jgi:hypothetical protein